MASLTRDRVLFISRPAPVVIITLRVAEAPQGCFLLLCWLAMVSLPSIRDMFPRERFLPVPTVPSLPDFDIAIHRIYVAKTKQFEHRMVILS